MPFGRTYSIRESAAYLGVSTKTVRRYLKKGLLKHKITEGKHGPQIAVFKKSLDTILGQVRRLSKVKDDMLELSRLFQEAPQEVRETVLKILRSTTGKKHTSGSTSLFPSLFKRRSDDYQ